jgi:hypothetical protein
MGSSRVDEQMAVLVEALRELRGDVREMRRCVERLANPIVTIERKSDEPIDVGWNHDPLCTWHVFNADGSRMPCNCTPAVKGPSDA